MRKYIFSVLIALLSLPVIAQQQQSQARVILDKTAEAFRKAGGVKVDFTVKAVTNGLVEGVENGTIQLKGEKFVLKTSDIITWFDGKTQWSYMTKNDEVNVSNPTQEELQQINPYTFLYMYQKGFSYKLGAIDMFSIPPATTISASPAAIISAAMLTQFRPEPHTTLIVTAGVSIGRPALMDA